MSSFGTVTLKEVRAMLETCAPGHVFRAHGVHYFLVAFHGQTFPSLPTGPHGKGNPDIQVGVVRRMAKRLGILACAIRELQL
ncbi:MAG TPA: hypothetical protein DCQ64_19965 [Candidatus Rokubacteria bacterium]|nr:hypothetical protein [Candidatus Rokubacteria bacterium]